MENTKVDDTSIVNNITDTVTDEKFDTIKYILDKLGLTEELPDKDGLYNGLIIPRDQANFMYTIAWLSFPSGIYAITQNYYDLALVPLGVWITSLTYWKKPTYGWRRNLDMIYVVSGLCYQLYRSLDAENRNAYIIILSVGVIFYPISNIILPNSAWLSTIAHSMVHILGNISNLVLYSGNIQRWI